MYSAYPASGMYGQNPHYTLAETPYARMTGMLTPLSDQMIPGTSSYIQPTFVDMNQYYGNTGIPRYPSFIGGTAMMNPQIPIAQPGFQYQQQAMYQQPMYQQPMYQQPMYQQPMVQQSYQQPAANQSVNQLLSQIMQLFSQSVV